MTQPSRRHRCAWSPGLGDGVVGLWVDLGKKASGVAVERKLAPLPVLTLQEGRRGS